MHTKTGVIFGTDAFILKYALFLRHFVNIFKHCPESAGNAPPLFGRVFGM